MFMYPGAPSHTGVALLAVRPGPRRIEFMPRPLRPEMKSALVESSRDCLEKSAVLMEQANQILTKSEARVQAFGACLRRLGHEDSLDNPYWPDDMKR